MTDKMTTPNEHTSFASLLDIADRRTPADAEAAAHLATCRTCTEELQRLEDLVGLMTQDESVDAPRDVLAYAINIFNQRNVDRKPSLVQRIVAALSFDSFDRAPAFGVRSGEAAARQLVYSAGESDLDLRIEQQERDRWTIAGQILGEQCAGGEIKLTGKNESASALLNDQCEFTLPAVPAGNYELVLRLADVEIEVPRIEVGA